ncbi:MAG: type II toxin-antitoxin system RelE/ParE family toxin [Candidatus Dadabacteria bacterium]
MIIQFRNLYLEKLFEGKTVPGKPKYRESVIVSFKKTILMLQFLDSISELKKFKGLHFKALKGTLKGYYSVRVNIQYRLIFSIEEDQSVMIKEILVIEDLSKHYE